MPRSGCLVFPIGVSGIVLRSDIGVGLRVGEEPGLQAVELLAGKQATFEH